MLCFIMASWTEITREWPLGTSRILLSLLYTVIPFLASNFHTNRRIIPIAATEYWRTSPSKPPTRGFAPGPHQGLCPWNPLGETFFYRKKGFPQTPFQKSLTLAYSKHYSLFIIHYSLFISSSPPTDSKKASFAIVIKRIPLSANSQNYAVFFVEIVEQSVG